MTDVKRLLDDPAADPTDVALVEYARSERMSDESRQRILMGLGIGAIGTVTTATTTAKAASSSGLWTAKLKLLTALGVSVGVGAGSLWWLGADGSPDAVTVTAQQQSTQASEAPPPALEEATPEALPPAETAVDEPEPTKPAPKAHSTATKPLTAKDTKQVEPQPSLADELAAIRAARATLARGNASGALAAVAEYDKKFPVGRLKQEARVVEIEALMRLGQTAKAERIAQPFLKNQSPYSERVRSLLKR